MGAKKRLLLQEAFEEFLVEKLGHELARKCYVPGAKSGKYEVALPSSFYDEFQDWFVDRLDNGLLDRQPKNSVI